MGFHLQIRNYRGIQDIRFNPEGVCLLVGPNGSGKSTLLSGIELVRNAFEHGFDIALNDSGGPWGFTNFDLPSETSTLFQIEIGDIHWELSPTVNAGGVVHPVPEIAKQNGTLLQPPLQEKINAAAAFNRGQGLPHKKTLFLKRLFDTLPPTSDSEPLRNFAQILTQYQSYRNYRLWKLRKSGSQAGSDIIFQYDGQNAFSVLRNWHTSRPLRERYDFVMETLREAFPSFFDDLDFESAGQTVSIRIFQPKSDDAVPVFFVSNGFLSAMLHLMAVCSAPDGGILAIDEIENGLHPYAIRTIIEAIRDRSEEKHLTVLLASHSPFVLNEFRENPHQVYVMDQNEEDQLVRLDELRDPEWLRYFSLGDLYGTDFAKQEK